MNIRFSGDAVLGIVCLWAVSLSGAVSTYNFVTLDIAGLRKTGWTVNSLDQGPAEPLRMNATDDSIRTPAFSGNVTSVVYAIRGSATTAADFFRTKKIHTSGSDTWAASYAGGQAVNTAQQTNRIAIESGEDCRQVEFSFFKGSTGGTVSLYTLTVFYEDGGAVPNPPELLPVTEGGEGVRTLCWNASEGAESYRVSLWSVTGAPPATVAEGFDNFPATTNAGWTVSVAADDAVYTAAGFYGTTSPALKLQNTAQFVITPVYPNPVTNLSFWAKSSSESTTAMHIQASADDGDTWADVSFPVHTVSYGAERAIRAYEKALGYNRFRFAFTGRSAPFAFDDVTVQYASGLEYFPILSGVSTGTDTDKTVTGLTSGNYRFSVVAVNANGDSAASAEGAFRISGTPPNVSIASSRAFVSVGRTLTQSVTTAMTDGDAVTAMTVSAADVTGSHSWKRGVFTYTPSATDVGLKTFVFTATDADGASVPATLTVTVAPANCGTLILLREPNG